SRPRDAPMAASSSPFVANATRAEQKAHAPRWRAVSSGGGTCRRADPGAAGRTMARAARDSTRARRDASGRPPLRRRRERGRGARRGGGGGGGVVGKEEWMEKEGGRLGYEPLVCDCGGRGVLVRTSITGTHSDPCHGCGGSGRWWALIGRHYLTVRLRDDEML